MGYSKKEDLLKFVSNGGLEDCKYQGSALWHNNPNPDDPIYIDSYRFKSLGKIGYVAFFYNHITGNWLIKSFKRSKERDGAYSLSLIPKGGNCYE